MNNQPQPKESVTQEWFSVAEACAYIRIGQTKLRELIKDRKITHSRLPNGSLLLSKHALDSYVKSFEVPSMDVADEVAAIFNKKKTAPKPSRSRAAR
jgi:excisionase family DNA binding protein